MISNFDRIYQEIYKEARRVCKDSGYDPVALQRLALEIVNLLDRHRIEHIHAIKQRIRGLIEATVVAQRKEGVKNDQVLSD